MAKKEIDFVLGRFLIRSVTKRSRISAIHAAHHFNAEPICPNSELLNCRGAKRVGGGKQNLRRASPSRTGIANRPYLQIMRKFSNRRGIAGLVHAYNHGEWWFTCVPANPMCFSSQ